MKTSIIVASLLFCGCTVYTVSPSPQSQTPARTGPAASTHDGSGPGAEHPDDSRVAEPPVAATEPVTSPRPRRPVVVKKPVPRPTAQPVDYYRLTQAGYRRDRRFAARIDPAHIDYRRLHAAIFFVTNDQRIRHRMKPLAYHAHLELAAERHAKRMAELGFYSHGDPHDNRLATPTMRGLRAGIRNAKLAENIYRFHGLMLQKGRGAFSLPGRGRYSYAPNGTPIPMHSYLSFADAIVAGWMASPGHRANILHKSALELGVGTRFFYNGNWPYFTAVQNFQFFAPIRTE